MKKLFFFIALLLPLVSQGQGNCDSLSLPYSEDFDSYSGCAPYEYTPSNYPNVTLPDCWTFINMSTSYDTPPQVFLSAFYGYVDGRCLFFRGAKYVPIYAVMPSFGAMDSISQLMFTYRVYSGIIVVGVMSNATDTTTFVPIDTLGYTNAETLVELTIPAGTINDSSHLVFCFRNSANWQTAYIDEIYFDAPTCFKVKDVAIVDSMTTASSITLTWLDSMNSGATYSVFDMSDTSLIQSGISTNTYTVNGLTPATEYRFAVKTDCGNGDLSMMSLPVTGQTACVPVSLPWICGFESDEAPSNVSQALPFCCNRYSPNTSPYIYIYNMGHNGTRSLVFSDPGYYYYSDTFAFILPEVNVSEYPMNNNHLTLWAESHSSADMVLHIYTMSNLGDMSTLTFIDSIVVPSIYTQFNIPLDEAPATDPYVVVSMNGGFSYGYIDDIVLDVGIPTCLRVKNLEVANKTANSITIKWRANAENSNAIYRVYDMGGDSIVASGITDTFFTVTNLNPFSEYRFAVKTDCGNGDTSALSNTITVRTDCGGYSIPYIRNFDNIVENESVDSCWTKIGSNNNFFIQNASSYAHSGSRYYKLTGSSGSIVALPEMEYDIRYLQLRFWLRPQDFTEYRCGRLSVGYITDVSDVSTYVEVESYLYSDFSGYEERTVVFSGAPVGACIAMQYKPLNTNWAWYVDDVTVEMAPSCPHPILLKANDITNSQAVLTWTGNSTSYNIYYVTPSDTTFLQTVYGTSLNLTGLSASTEYRYGITSNCGVEVSDMAFVSFRTLCGSITLPFIEDFEENSTSVDCWTSEGSAQWSIGAGDCRTNTSTEAYSGNRNAKICHTTTGNTTKYISPVINNGDGLVLTFAHMHIMWGWEIDTLKVCYRSSVDGEWNYVAEYYDNTNWTVDSVTINDYVYLVAFEMVDGYGWGVAIDSVVFDYNPNYPYMVSIAVDSVTDSSATISWTGNGTSFEVYGGTVDSALSYVVSATQPQTYTFTGLAPATEYTFSVMAVKDNLRSKPLSVTVVTDSVVVIPDSVWITVNVNDALMGTTNPEPGNYHLEEQDIITITAIPFEGYDFSMWSSGDTNTVTTFTVFEDMTITAIFLPKQPEGIDNVEGMSINAYGKDGILVLHDATGREVYLYDRSGRILYHTAKASENEQYVVPLSGVYLVRVVGVGTKKVVIVR